MRVFDLAACWTAAGQSVHLGECLRAQYRCARRHHVPHERRLPLRFRPERCILLNTAEFRNAVE